MIVSSNIQISKIIFIVCTDNLWLSFTLKLGFGDQNHQRVKTFEHHTIALKWVRKHKQVDVHTHPHLSLSLNSFSFCIYTHSYRMGFSTLSCFRARDLESDRLWLGALLYFSIGLWLLIVSNTSLKLSLLIYRWEGNTGVYCKGLFSKLKFM